MRLEDYFEFLAPNQICLKGTSLGIETILYDYIHRGRKADEIATTHPTVSQEQVFATILYYLHDKDKVHQYMTEWIERSFEYRRPNSDEWGQLAESGSRYEVKRAQEIKFLLDEHVDPASTRGSSQQVARYDRVVHW